MKSLYRIQLSDGTTKVNSARKNYTLKEAFDLKVTLDLFAAPDEQYFVQTKDKAKGWLCVNKRGEFL